MTDITELAQSLKAAAEKATHGQWLVTEQDCRWNIDDESGRAIAIAQQRKPIRDDYKQAERTANAEFIALANPANILALVEALEKAQQRIEELESDLSEWTDCKHDGATYYDMSGQERCGRCGADI
jgi:hypothetical protein